MSSSWEQMTIIRCVADGLMPVLGRAVVEDYCFLVASDYPADELAERGQLG